MPEKATVERGATGEARREIAQHAGRRVRARGNRAHPRGQARCAIDQAGDRDRSVKGAASGRQAEAAEEGPDIRAHAQERRQRLSHWPGRHWKKPSAKTGARVAEETPARAASRGVSQGAVGACPRASPGGAGASRPRSYRITEGTNHGHTEEDGMRTNASAARELVITRELDTPRDHVWRLFTDREHASEWWGPKNFTVSQLEMDLRPGGRWRAVITIAGRQGVPAVRRLSGDRPTGVARVHVHVGEGRTRERDALHVLLRRERDGAPR